MNSFPPLFVCAVFSCVCAVSETVGLCTLEGFLALGLEEKTYVDIGLIVKQGDLLVVFFKSDPYINKIFIVAYVWVFL